jgi:hypothetical protein
MINALSTRVQQVLYGLGHVGSCEIVYPVRHEPTATVTFISPEKTVSGTFELNGSLPSLSDMIVTAIVAKLGE